jgi:DNA-binding transcriptional regulator YiaG
MPRPRNTPEVIWSKVDKRGPDECWPWIGWRNTNGYGRFELFGKAYYAHRAVFSLAYPEVQLDLNAPASKHAHGFIRHKCDNPICCNPAHLELGTHADNMRDKVERGRQKKYISTESPRAKLTAEQVHEIRVQPKESRGMLAMKYGVSIQTIKAVRSGRHYADI